MLNVKLRFIKKVINIQNNMWLTTWLDFNITGHKPCVDCIEQWTSYVLYSVHSKWEKQMMTSFKSVTVPYFFPVLVLVPVLILSAKFSWYRFQCFISVPNLSSTDTCTFRGTKFYQIRYFLATNFKRYRFQYFFGAKFFRFRYHQKTKLPGCHTLLPLLW